jgi:hypothetical protein
MEFIPFDDEKISSDDVLQGISQWQEENDALGYWAISLERDQIDWEYRDFDI